MTRIVPALLALLVAGCGPDTIGRDWHRVEPPIVALDFTLPQLDGKPASLSDYRGHVVIVEFWATWCGPCQFSLPSLEAIYRRYRARKVTVLLINEGESAEQVRAWGGQRYMAPILLDQNKQVGALYQVQGIPRLFIIDQTGQVVYTHSGYGGGLERNLTLILKDLGGWP